MSKARQDILNWHTWIPYSRFDGTVDTKYCRESVPMGGRSVGFHQCCRKPKVYIDNIGYCTQHAKVVRSAIDSLKKSTA